MGPQIAKEEWVALVTAALEAASPGLPYEYTGSGYGASKARHDALATRLGVGKSTIRHWMLGRVPTGLARDSAMSKMKSMIAKAKGK